jgi:hypothetical protein
VGGAGAAMVEHRRDFEQECELCTETKAELEESGAACAARALRWSCRVRVASCKKLAMGRAREARRAKGARTRKFGSAKHVVVQIEVASHASASLLRQPSTQQHTQTRANVNDRCPNYTALYIACNIARDIALMVLYRSRG